MDTDAFMLYDVFTCNMSVLKSDYLEKITSRFLMFNGVMINHSNDETNFYDVFNEANVKFGT